MGNLSSRLTRIEKELTAEQLAARQLAAEQLAAKQQAAEQAVISVMEGHAPAWADYAAARGYLQDCIRRPAHDPKTGFQLAATAVADGEFMAAVIACGATFLRAWARLVEVGATPNPNPSFETSEVVGVMREHADDLDAANTPDLSAYHWDTATYASDERGEHVFDSDVIWTWRERLAAARRFQERYGKPYGFNQTSDVSFVNRARKRH